MPSCHVFFSWTLLALKLILSPLVLLKVFLTVKIHHDHDNSYKVKHLIEVMAYSFKGLVHFHHSEEHGGVQADMVLAAS